MRQWTARGDDDAVCFIYVGRNFLEKMVKQFFIT